jgi:hypothetical protein
MGCFRTRVLQEELHCRICGRRATDVDHIVAVADGGGTDDRPSLRALSRDHHKQWTAEQNRQRRKTNKEKNLGSW